MEVKLLDSLHHKLDDLESKIRVYRGGLIIDFQRYYHDLLRDLNSDVASSIERAITPSFTNYPTLRPELKAAHSRPPPGNPKPATFQQSLAPTVLACIGAVEDSRQREVELQGLFTPSYLPLLDSSPPNQRPVISVATATTPQTTTVPFPPLSVGLSNLGADTSAGQDMATGMLSDSVGDVSPVTAQVYVEPDNIVRTATDGSTSSVCSDKSDSKVRRSALRRSSSLIKAPQSPRRVRFEFMGAEVLPTASPQSSNFITPVASSLFLSDKESIVSDTILGDDVDEFEPPPRRTSSTDALRALSRTPMEAGTVWTVINPDAHEATLQQENVNALFETSSSVESNVSSAVWPKPNTFVEDVEGSRTQYSGCSSTDDESEDNNDVNDSSYEEGFLAMGKPESYNNKKLVPAGEANNRPSTITTTLNQLPASSSSEGEKRQAVPDDDEEGDDYDDMFHFEPGGLSAPPKPRQLLPPPQSDEISDDESHASSEAQPQQALCSTSPAVSILRPSKTKPTMPKMSRFQPGSLGSYKGRPVIMPVVRNPEVHARAASLGQFNTFVGGLDGRSGMDEGDLGGFRASVFQSGFTGTPRSFTERYMMEEAQAKRERSRGAAQ